MNTTGPAASYAGHATSVYDAPIFRPSLLLSCSPMKGWKAVLYNNIFVGMFNMLPRAFVRRFGWHLIAFCTK